MEIAKRIDLDFIVEGPPPFTHIDVKTPMGSEILRKQKQHISVQDMSYRIGQKIIAQKNKFVGLKNGPLTPNNVDHIVDLCYILSSEKMNVKKMLYKKSETKVFMLR